MVAMDPVSENELVYAIDRFWETFPNVWNRIRGHIREIVSEEFDITVEQFHILRHIRKGVDSVSELAEMRQISRSAVSQSVETLVSKGLIRRQQSGEDRRFVQLQLTPEGSEIINIIFEKNRAWMLEKMRALSVEELNSIMQGLESLHDVFDEPLT